MAVKKSKTPANRQAKRLAGEEPGRRSLTQRIVRHTVHGDLPGVVALKLRNNGIPMTMEKVRKVLDQPDVQAMLEANALANQEQIARIYAKTLQSIENTLDNPPERNLDVPDYIQTDSVGSARRDYLALLKVHKGKPETAGGKKVGAMTLQILEEALKVAKKQRVKAELAVVPDAEPAFEEVIECVS